jgi:hypothetical protein
MANDHPRSRDTACVAKVAQTRITVAQAPHHGSWLSGSCVAAAGIPYRSGSMIHGGVHTSPRVSALNVSKGASNGRQAGGNIRNKFNCLRHLFGRWWAPSSVDQLAGWPCSAEAARCGARTATECRRRAAHQTPRRWVMWLATTTRCFSSPCDPPHPARRWRRHPPRRRLIHAWSIPAGR